MCGSSSATQTVAANAPGDAPRERLDGVERVEDARALEQSRRQHRAQLAHDRGRLDAVPDHVTDGQRTRPSGRVAESNQSPPAACSRPATR